jgi:Putative serine dehydratase domain
MPILCRRMVVSASRRGLRGRPKECQLTFGTAHSEPPRRLRPQPRPRRRLDQGLRAEPFGWATVMNRPAEDRAIVDARLKALAFDSGPPLVCDEPAATSERASDEHGRLLGRHQPSPNRRRDPPRPRPWRPDRQPLRLDWPRFMLQFQYVDVEKRNSAGTVQVGQRFETLAARARAAW